MVDEDQSTEVEEELEQDDDLEQDALDAFGEATGKDKPGETKGDDKQDDPDKDEDDDHSKEDESDDSGDDAADKDSEDASETPAKAAVEKRLKDLGVEDDKSDDDKKDDGDKTSDQKKDDEEKADTKAQEKEGAGEEKPPASKAPSLTKEAVYEYFDTLESLGLPKKPIVVGDREINLQEFQEDFPEHFNTTVVIAGAMVKEALAKLDTVKPDQVAAPDKVKALEETILQQGALIGESLYFNGVDDLLSESGNDINSRRLARGKEFKDWLNDQAKGIKKLAESPDAEDGALVIGLYLEQTATKKADQLDAEARNKKKRQTDIHGSTMRSGGNKEKATRSAKDDEAEAEDGFNEYIKKAKD